MSRKRFTTMVAVVLLLGAAGLLSLYMTLGKMSQALRVQGRSSAPGAAVSSGEEKIEQMTLTPAGESQLRHERERAQAGQAVPAGATAPTGTAAPPAQPAASPAPATKPEPPVAPAATAKTSGASGAGGH